MHGITEVLIFNKYMDGLLTVYLFGKKNMKCNGNIEYSTYYNGKANYYGHYWKTEH